MAGYKGYSMSNNAVSAYESGEKPISKWTKTDIIEGLLSQLSKKQAVEIEPLLKKKTVSDLKNKFLYYSSWHHTSSKYNKTDFYSIKEIDEVELRNYVGLNVTTQTLLKGLSKQKEKKNLQANSSSIYDKIKKNKNYSVNDIIKLSSLYNLIIFSDNTKLYLNSLVLRYNGEESFEFNPLKEDMLRWKPKNLIYSIKLDNDKDLKEANLNLHKILNKKVKKFELN